MSNLVVNQLENNDIINIKVRFPQSKTLHSVRLKMLKHGVISDGEFKLDVLEGSDVLATSTLGPSDFAQVTASFAHGYFKFNLPYPVRINISRDVGYIEINLRLSVTSHTNSDTSFIGLIKQHEFKFVDEYGTYPTQASTDSDKAWYAPYGVELYTYSNK